MKTNQREIWLKQRTITLLSCDLSGKKKDTGYWEWAGCKILLKGWERDKGWLWWWNWDLLFSLQLGSLGESATYQCPHQNGLTSCTDRQWSNQKRKSILIPPEFKTLGQGLGKSTSIWKAFSIALL